MNLNQSRIEARRIRAAKTIETSKGAYSILFGSFRQRDKELY